MLKKTLSCRFPCCNQALLHSTRSSLDKGQTIQTPEEIFKKDSLFEVRATNAKFGNFALDEVGRDVASLFNAKRVAVITDSNCCKLDCYFDMIKNIKLAGVDVAVWDETVVEPTDESFTACGKFIHESNVDCVVSFGGGSVMDTAKAGNMLSQHVKETNFDLMQFVPSPLGGGRQPTNKLLPHVACPTTTGTASEFTPYAIMDIRKLHLKTGLAFKALYPDLAIVDPRPPLSQTKDILSAAGFDILCHAAESYTAISFLDRIQGFPTDPSKKVQRPTLQGRNPFADSGCREALRLLGKNYRESFVSKEANEKLMYNMAFASMCAGISFGNAGVHMCHSLSYAVASKVKPNSFRALDGYSYDESHATIAHGYAVGVSAPAVMRKLASLKDPDLNERLLEIAMLLSPEKYNNNNNNIKTNNLPDPKDLDNSHVCGEIIAETLIDYMKLLKFPNGCKGCGYSPSDAELLGEACFKQKRLIANAPFEVKLDDCVDLARNSMSYW